MLYKRLSLNIIIILLAGFLVLPFVRAESSSVYINKNWNFQINLPQGWYLTELGPLIERFNQEKQYEQAEFIKKSGLIVSASQFASNQKTGFNPNLNISSRNIEITPAPKRSQLMVYAKQILLSLVPKGNDLVVEDLSFNNLIGVQSSYRYQLSGNNKILNVLALTTIIIDEQTNNYFIIVASCPEESSKIYKDLFRDTVRSFKLLKEMRNEG